MRARGVRLFAALAMLLLMQGCSSLAYYAQAVSGHMEMIGQARLALDMMKKKRLHLGVDRVKARSEVQALFEKAKKGR